MMSRKKGNWHYNYPKLIEYLVTNELDYWESIDHQHFKIFGPTKAIELWPSRMTYHFLQAEEGDNNRYNRLSINFNEKELETIL